MTDNGFLRLPALEMQQGPGRLLYSFCVDGKVLPSFTTVSRIYRDQVSQVGGYQRPEVLTHIREIKAYIESESPLMPNAIVVAFDTRVRFEPNSNQNNNHALTRFGELVIPIDPSCPDEEKPGWIVDGQQRVAAVREAEVARFPMFVTAFISDTEKAQREQFILVNSVKPLPKGLIYELLPIIDTKLPTYLAHKQFPAKLLERLNFDLDSPLQGMIKTPTQPDGLIQDNSILKMIGNSLNDGALYRYRNPTTGKGDIDSMLIILKRFWRAVSIVFSDAWGLPPRRSRLVHGAGIVSLGFIMDAIADRHRNATEVTEELFIDDLTPMKDICRWTDGFWDFGQGIQRKWNEVQNVPKDVQLLANHLLMNYKQLVWNRNIERRSA